MRPRTLPASIAPVIVGAVAAYLRLQQSTMCPAIYPSPAYCAVNYSIYSWRMSIFAAVALLCALVALLLQIAVNFANDYSDGIRGTDAGRAVEESQSDKPQRLAASGLVAPRQVLVAAGISAGLACVCGVAAILLSQSYWLFAVGAVSLLAGWFYTGGKHPYGYAGFGELGVFLFFGLAAVLGTQYALSGSVDMLGAAGAVLCGCFACALLMVNNLRDIDGDRVAGKRTLAVRLGLAKARRLLLAVYLVPLAVTVYAALAPVVQSVIQWLGLSCVTAYSTPGCAAGSTTCATTTVTSVQCPPALVPSLSTWLLAAAGLAGIAAGVLLVRSVSKRQYGRALTVSGLTPLLLAAVAVIAGLARVFVL